MSTTTKSVNVALIGNPNTGKSTLFNALCGIRQRTGNYPGVTIEKKIGQATIGGNQYSIIDLPGTYSLAPRSPDEMIAVDVLLGRQNDVQSPDVVLCIIDASNLQRNLYLVSQVLEIDRPVVLALNMVDVAKKKGITIDLDKLRQRLGIPVIEIQANRKVGIDDLKQALCEAPDHPLREQESPFPIEFQQEVDLLQEKISASSDNQTKDNPLPRYLVERLLLDVGGFIEQSSILVLNSEIRTEIELARERLKTVGAAVPAIEAMSRYQWVGKILEGAMTRPTEKVVSFSDKADRFLTHKVFGTLAFILLMIILFQAVFYIAEPASAVIDWGQASLDDLVTSQISDGPLKSLVSRGIIGGVGSVLVFLPQIFILFLFIAVLEDCGYMARAAYLMDKLMSKVGLSGKSFIPLLSSFACAIPGIMAARVIENRRDRLTTILVAPLMTCSARLPVYALLIAAFIPSITFISLGSIAILNLQGLVLFGLFALGIVTSIIVALILKKTILKGETPPFVMELPGYKLPALRVVLHRMVDSGWAFIKGAGTLIFAVSIIIWAAAYYPHNPERLDAKLFEQQEQLTHNKQSLAASAADQDNAKQIKKIDEQLTEIENDINGAYLEQSYLGRSGQVIEPMVKPLGWDWKIGCAVIASFPAREVVIGTLGVIYKLGEDVDEESVPLKETLKKSTWAGSDQKVFNVPVSLSIMVFFALCAQCVGTLTVMKRETNSWRWPLFTFVYMTTLAYFAAWVTYEVGMLFVA